MLNLLIVILAILFSGHVAPPESQTPDRPPEEIAHLPQEIQNEIIGWRERLRNAKCVKVICETDETWRDMYRLDETGSPIVVLHERFQVHAWMTPDLLWMVIFPYTGETADTTNPQYQLLWTKSSGMVRERVWDPTGQNYRVSRYPAPGEFGAENGSLDSNGCIYATVMQSWLTVGDDLATHASIVRSIAFFRHPNISIVPPDPAASGVWLDVFHDELVRDSEADPEDMYRRNDFMLLARDESNQPELREWRTIVLTDRGHGGAQPQEITGIRRLSYHFSDRVPEELRLATDTFEKGVDEIVAASP